MVKEDHWTHGTIKSYKGGVSMPQIVPISHLKSTSEIKERWSGYFKYGFVWKTAAQWRNAKEIKGKTPNIRDFASAEELVVLINLEDTNADLIRQEVPKIERLKILREKAYRQLELLRKNQDAIAALKKNLIEDTETNGWFPKQNRL